MSETKDGGPAFPASTWREEGGVQIGTPQPGISKREYYAAAALQGWLARYTPEKGVPDIGHTADFCFKVADAMLEAGDRQLMRLDTLKLWAEFGALWAGKTNSPEYVEAYNKACETIPNGKLP